VIGRGALGGARAALRLARRDALRNRGRSAVIGLMVFVPVLAAVVISVLARSAQLDPQDRVMMALGETAQARIVWDFDASPLEQDPQITGYSRQDDARQLSLSEFQRRLVAAVPAEDQLIAQREAQGRTFTLGARTIRFGRLVELDYAALGPKGPVQQVEGRAPRTDNEVVVTQSLARAESLRVGDRMTLTGTGRQFTVTGVVGGPGLIGDRQVIAQPRAILPPYREVTAPGSQSATWYVIGSKPVTWKAVRQINGSGGLVISRDGVAHHPESAEDFGAFARADSTTVGITAVVALLILLQIALLAGPAIAVGARRNERSLALIAASGAQPGQLRLIVLLTSAVVGLAASVAGAICGTALGAVTVAFLRSSKDVTLPRVDVHFGDLAGVVVAGAIAVTSQARSGGWAERSPGAGRDLPPGVGAGPDTDRRRGSVGLDRGRSGTVLLHCAGAGPTGAGAGHVGVRGGRSDRPAGELGTVRRTLRLP
jgi:putative ABC transport system permease protein